MYVDQERLERFVREIPWRHENVEANLIRLACSDAPEGHSRWTLRFLADTRVLYEDTGIESVSHENVRQTLKKRTPATLIQTLGDSTRPRRRVRLPH